MWLPWQEADLLCWQGTLRPICAAVRVGLCPPPFPICVPQYRLQRPVHRAPPMEPFQAASYSQVPRVAPTPIRRLQTPEPFPSFHGRSSSTTQRPPIGWTGREPLPVPRPPLKLQRLLGYPPVSLGVTRTRRIHQRALQNEAKLYDQAAAAVSARKHFGLSTHDIDVLREEEFVLREESALFLRLACRFN